MKWPLHLLACLLALPCPAQSQTATVLAYSRSLCLSDATTSYGGASTFAFTTVDNARGLPLFVLGPGGVPIFSNELRPVPGSRGVYQSDFEVLAGTVPEVYGTLELTLSNQDTDHDGIPDVLDPAQPEYSMVTGTGYSSWPSSNSFTMNLRFSRTAGSPTGAFSGNWSFAGSSYTINGALSQMLLQGSAIYTRGLTNQLEFQLTRLVQDGTTNTLTGAVAYTASAGQISLPRFTLTDTNGQTYTALHTVLSRHGSRYVGNLSLVDGAPETPWPDYVNWILTLTDPNDSNSNSIPDISDPSPALLPSAPLCVLTNGPGSVSPALGGQNLVLGKTYHLTATPAVGYLFAGWSGDLVSSARTLTFLMVTNLNVQANFVPNPFYPVRGTYYGLIGDTNNLSNQALGYFTATTTAGGHYSAKLQLGGKSYSVSGGLDTTGSSYPLLQPRSPQPLFVRLHLDLTNATGFSGSIGDGTWSAPIVANKCPFDARANRCAYAGKYTFALPVFGAPEGLPLGSSFGTVSVNATGRLLCSGWLADGTRFTQSTALSGTGDWPFYAALYRHQGCLAGWLTVTNQDPMPIAGLPGWVKPSATTKLAPQGFTNRVICLLSRYSAPGAGISPVGWTNGLISFNGGNLEEPFWVDLSLGSHNKLASASTNQLSVHLMGNGLFQGKVIPPGAKRPVSFRGALLQGMDQGFGYLAGTNASAEIEFGAMQGGPSAPPSSP